MLLNLLQYPSLPSLSFTVTKTEDIEPRVKPSLFEFPSSPATMCAVNVLSHSDISSSMSWIGTLAVIDPALKVTGCTPHCTSFVTVPKVQNIMQSLQ